MLTPCHQEPSLLASSATRTTRCISIVQVEKKFKKASKKGKAEESGTSLKIASQCTVTSLGQNVNGTARGLISVSHCSTPFIHHKPVVVVADTLFPAIALNIIFPRIFSDE